MILLIDASGEQDRALSSLTARGLQPTEVVTKEELKPKNLVNAWRRLRASRPQVCYIFCRCLRTQFNRFPLKLAALLSGARRIQFCDELEMGSVLRRGDILIRDLPLYLWRCFYGLLLVALFMAVYATLWVWARVRNNYPSTTSLSKRLCYIKTDFWHDLKAGGSVTHTREFVNAGCDLGHEIAVFSSDPLTHYGLKPRVKVIEPAQGLYDLPILISQMEFNLRFPFVVRQTLEKRTIGGIYQRNSSNNFSGVFLSFLLRAPFVLEFNTPLAWAAKNWGSGIGLVPRLCEGLNLQGAYRIAVVSDALKQELLRGGVPERKIIVNPNGVDPERFSPQIDTSTVRGRFPLEKSLVGFIGVFGQWHGVLTLMSCVKHVIKEFSNAHFVIIGDGALKQKMVEILVRDGMAQHVTFVGLVPHDTAPAYLNACDILVSPHENMADGSPFFGSPTKIFEYMSMGKPIVASNVGQLGHLLDSEVDALLVKEKDEALLACAIVRLLRDPGLRKRLGSAARAKVINFYTWAKNFRRATDPLSEVITQGVCEETVEPLLADR